jgi:hypothetical protein
MAKLTVILLLIIALFAVPFQPVKTAIIALLSIIALSVPVYLFFRLQKYLFVRYKKAWHLIAISVAQFMCSAISAYWLFNQFDQGVEDGTIDGPVGFVFAGQIALLATAMFIIWVANSITGGIVYSRLRNRQ